MIIILTRDCLSAEMRISVWYVYSILIESVSWCRLSFFEKLMVGPIL